MNITRLGYAFALAVGAFSCTGEQTSRVTSDLTGALFTTTVNGTAVDQNIFDAKSDVYIDGGPGPGAPSTAAALPAGDYYYQVTDPSGMTVLSTDDLECRRVRVSTDGVIVEVYPGPAGCLHLSGIDQDQAALGALTVQLMPYADTPNSGGEYKAWITPVGDIGPNGEFLNPASKSDNFKVRVVTSDPVCGNGTLESGEQCDDGNGTDGDGCTANCTPETPPPPVCGNGVVEGSEQCDDGNTADGDGCTANCTPETPPPPPACGNGVLEGSEVCDDGNTVDGDGCTANCTPETPPPPACCGNGVLEAGEQCDDGNTTSGDGCSDVCVPETPPCDETVAHPVES